MHFICLPPSPYRRQGDVYYILLYHNWLSPRGMEDLRGGSLSWGQTFTFFFLLVFVYYESIKREPKIRGIYECRCDERLKTKTKKFTRLPYTGLVLELEHLKIETRLINERFANAKGECENFGPWLVYYESIKREPKIKGIQRVSENVSPRSFLLSTFFHFAQKFLYQERHARDVPGTKTSGHVTFLV